MAHTSSGLHCTVFPSEIKHPTRHPIFTECYLIKHKDNFILLSPPYYPLISFLITFCKVSLTIYISRLLNPLQFHYLIDTKYPIQNKKSNILVSIFFPNTSFLHTSFKVRDHTSQSYKTCGKLKLY